MAPEKPIATPPSERMSHGYGAIFIGNVEGFAIWRDAARSERYLACFHDLDSIIRSPRVWLGEQAVLNNLPKDFPISIHQFCQAHYNMTQ